MEKIGVLSILPVQILHALLYIIQIILYEANGFVAGIVALAISSVAVVVFAAVAAAAAFLFPFIHISNWAYTVHFLLLSLFISFLQTKAQKITNPH